MTGQVDCAGMRPFALVALVLCASLLAGCSGAGNGEAKPPAREHAIAIHGTDYHPNTLVAAAGDSLWFENHEAVPHTATAKASPMGDLESGDIAPDGGDHTVTDLKAGAYTFTCRHHSNMRLSVTVTA